ncbi:MAG TPA: hypothetical protein VJ861_10405 [Treponemataceae bacterium]|nr:hypothetical protein [Treponemataceae bacterium]
MEKIKEILSVIFISALIGLGVGVFFELINKGQIVSGMINGAISGGLIGLVSHSGFMLVYLRFRKNPITAFVIVIAIIAAGTGGFCLFWNVSFPVPGLPIILVSEILGITATAILFSNYIRLNNKLKGKIKELSTISD